MIGDCTIRESINIPIENRRYTLLRQSSLAYISAQISKLHCMPYCAVGSGKGLDGLAKEAPLPGTSPSAPLAAAADDDDDDDDSVHSSLECPELSVEEMTTTMTTDTSSSVHPHTSSGDGSQQTRSLEITTASDSVNVTGASNSCKHYCHVFINTFEILILQLLVA